MNIIDKLIQATEQGKISWENESNDIFIDNFYTTINNIRVGIHVDYTDCVDTDRAVEEMYYLTIEAGSVEYIHNPKKQLQKLYSLMSNNNNNIDNTELLNESLNQLLNN